MGFTNKKLSGKLHIGFYFIIWIFVAISCEIIFNLKAVTIGNICTIFIVLIEGGGFAGIIYIIRKSLKIGKWLEYDYNGIEERLNGKTRLIEHIFLAIRQTIIKKIYPLFVNGIAGLLVMMLLFCAPFFAAFRGCNKTIALAENARGFLRESLRVEEKSEKDINVAEYKQDKKEKQEKDLDKEKVVETENVLREEKLTKDMGSMGIDSRNNFWLMDTVSDEQIDKVIQRILYYEKEYGDVEIEGLYEVVKEHINGLKQEVPSYMNEFFPIGREEILSESQLNIMESSFLKKIEQGKLDGNIPESGEFDELIKGRTDAVQQLKSYTLAKSLANDFLRYALEYNQQEIESKNEIYYYGMAILAGELQLNYAPNEARRRDAIVWLYNRYKEIGDSDLLEGTDEGKRAQYIEQCLKSML